MTSLTPAQRAVQEAVLNNPALAGTFQKMLEGLQRDGAPIAASEPDILVKALQTLPAVVLPEIAKMILDTYEYSKGVASLVIPPGVGFELAMQALNHEFKSRFPKSDRDELIDSDAMSGLIDDANEFDPRQLSAPRTVSLTMVAYGGRGVDDRSLPDILKQQGLRASYPWEQVILAAAHACQYRGQDLFRGVGVRGSEPSRVVENHHLFGIRERYYRQGHYLGDGSEFGASGTKLQ